MLMEREKTRRIKVGKIEIGGGAPISVQSMTKTDTRNVEKTISQIKELVTAGCEIVRIAIPDEEAASAFSKITGEYRWRREGSGGGKGGEGTRDPDKDRSERRLPIEGAPPKIRTSNTRGDG